jgi:hypothetical protein
MEVRGGTGAQGEGNEQKPVGVTGEPQAEVLTTYAGRKQAAVQWVWALNCQKAAVKKEELRSCSGLLLQSLTLQWIIGLPLMMMTTWGLNISLTLQGSS